MNEDNVKSVRQLCVYSERFSEIIQLNTLRALDKEYTVRTTETAHLDTTNSESSSYAEKWCENRALRFKKK